MGGGHVGGSVPPSADPARGNPGAAHPFANGCDASRRPCVRHVRHHPHPHRRRTRYVDPDTGPVQLQPRISDERLASGRRIGMAHRCRSDRRRRGLSAPRPRARGDMTRLILLLAALGAFLLPLVWTVLAAFGILPDNSTTPPSWKGSLTLGHFAEIGVAEPTFWQELATSTASAVCAAALTVGIAFLAAYGIARSSFRAGRALTQGFLVLASLPVMAYIIPLSDVMRRVHLVDTFAGVVLAEAAVTAPLGVFVLHGALVNLSPEWEEAALLDGAGLFRILGRVVFPLVASSVAATAIVLFVIDWNVLLVPLVLTSGEIKTIPVGMSDFFTFERELDWPTAAGALVVSLAPLGLLVAAFHRLLENFRFNLQNRLDIG